MKFNTERGTSIRGFFLKYRTNIEVELKQRCPQEHRNITDRLFSTVQDFNERNNVVHYGSLIQAGEIDNYEAILTKVRDIVRILIDNKILNCYNWYRRYQLPCKKAIKSRLIP